MLWKTGLIFLVLVFGQIPAEEVKPYFIEDVINQGDADKGDSRIVSGWEAYPGQHPHQASLRMVSGNGEVSACGGSVVHRLWVITAAHCTAGRITVVVRAGVTNLTTTQYISETNEWYNHPTYNDQLPGLVQPNDISVLKLQRPVVYTGLLKAIRVQPTVDRHRNYDGEVVYASGFGRTWTDGSTTEVLNWVYLRAVSNPSCAQTFGSIITDNTICARFYNVTSQSTCQGDSGGPLVHVAADGAPTLIGVASFVAGGSFGCHSGIPAGFIRPGPFIDWLRRVTGLDFDNLEEDEATEAPEEETTRPPVTEPDTDEPDTDEPDEEDSDEDDSDSEEDPDLSEILKKLEVKVKVKVKVNKFKIKKKVHIKKTIPA